MVAPPDHRFPDQHSTITKMEILWPSFEIILILRRVKFQKLRPNHYWTTGRKSNPKGKKNQKKKERKETWWEMQHAIGLLKLKLKGPSTMKGDYPQTIVHRKVPVWSANNKNINLNSKYSKQWPFAHQLLNSGLFLSVCRTNKIIQLIIHLCHREIDYLGPQMFWSLRVGSMFNEGHYH